LIGRVGFDRRTGVARHHHERSDRDGSDQRACARYPQPRFDPADEADDLLVVRGHRRKQLLLDELRPFGQRRREDGNVLVTQGHGDARLVVAQDINQREIAVQDVIAVGGVESDCPAGRTHQILVEVDRQLGSLGDDDAAVDAVELGDLPDDLVCQKPMAGLEVSQLTRREVAIAILRKVPKITTRTGARFSKKLT